MKQERFRESLGCKDLETRKFEFVAKTQFLSYEYFVNFLLFLCWGNPQDAYKKNFILYKKNSDISVIF